MKILFFCLLLLIYSCNGDGPRITMKVNNKKIQMVDSIVDFEIEIRNTYNCSVILFPLHSLGSWINPKNQCTYTFGLLLKSSNEKSRAVDQKFCWNYPENIYYEKGQLNKLTMQDMVIIPPQASKKIKIETKISCVNLKRDVYEARFELCQSLDNMSNIVQYKSIGEAIQESNALFYSKLIQSNIFILEVK